MAKPKNTLKTLDWLAGAYNHDHDSIPIQVPVMIYPEPGLADQYWIPWWIILIAVLAGILLLTLLVCILWKVTHTYNIINTYCAFEIHCNSKY